MGFGLRRNMIFMTARGLRDSRMYFKRGGSRQTEPTQRPASYHQKKIKDSSRNFTFNTWSSTEANTRNAQLSLRRLSPYLDSARGKILGNETTRIKIFLFLIVKTWLCISRRNDELAQSSLLSSQRKRTKIKISKILRDIFLHCFAFRLFFWRKSRDKGNLQIYHLR